MIQGDTAEPQDGYNRALVIGVLISKKEAKTLGRQN
jgi:hypothetical protein